MDGKARLSADVLCDGLGACLGECPQGAITVIERDAEAFDEAAVKRAPRASGAGSRPARCRRAGAARGPPARHPPRLSIASDAPRRRTAAAPARARRRSRAAASPSSPPRGPALAAAGAESRLGQWPVQLHLVPVTAPYFRGADLLVAADCVPVRLRRGSTTTSSPGRRSSSAARSSTTSRAYVEKLGRHLRRERDPERHGRADGGAVLRRDLDGRAPSLAASGKELPLRDVVVGVDGTLR